MKVILLQNIPKVGKKYEIKEVSRGFAQNLLFPKKLAEVATPRAMATIEKKRAYNEADMKIQEDLLVKNINDLAGATIIIAEKANEKGHLFAGVHKERIAAEIKAQTHLDISPEFIVLADHLKELGAHELVAEAHGHRAAFTLKIEKV